MKLFALTGGIACGKSTVATVLSRDHGVIVIDTDLIVRRLQEPGTVCFRRIKEAWPEVVVIASGGECLDRKRLSEIAFANPEVRKELAKIMNTRVFLAICAELLKTFLREPSDALVVLDAPLLFETKVLLPFVSGVLLVTASPAVQLRRLMARGGYTVEEAEQRIQSQMPQEEKISRANVVISNDVEGTRRLFADVKAAAQWMRSQNTALTGFNRVLLAIALGLGASAVAVRFLVLRYFL